MLEHITRNAPRWVSLVLAALLAVELACAAHSLVHPLPASPASDHPRPSPAPGRRERVDVAEIAAAHLFGVFVADPSTQDPKLTAANLVLAGTIATEDSSHGAAIITGDDSRSKVYMVGQTVGGALLHAVYLDHVLLDRNGALETLALPKLSAGATRLAIQSRSGPEPTLAAVSAPEAVGDVVQLMPSGLSGMRGFRVAGGRDFAAFRASGLRPNDLLTAINGTPLEDRESAQRSVNQLQSGHATVTVMRGSRPVDLTVNFGQ